MIGTENRPTKLDAVLDGALARGMDGLFISTYVSFRKTGEPLRGRRRFFL